MALEAIVYQYQQDIFSSSSSSYDHHHDYNYLLDSNTQLSGDQLVDWPSFDANYTNNYTNIIIDHDNNNNVWDNYNIISPINDHDHDLYDVKWGEPQQPDDDEGIINISPKGEKEEVRPKRRRARTRKNKDDIESQRMTHIAVERNRRKQMNDYLNELRSIMPLSYVQRGDQASIVGGAINFVKELEQSLQWISAKKQIINNHNNPDHHHDHHGGNTTTSSLPFGEFFTFPQYSTTIADDDHHHEVKGAMGYQIGGGCSGGGGGESVADVEVVMIESHALVKIRTKEPPKQLSKLVGGLQGLRLTILHLNTTKVDGVAFYSFSIKVEEDSRLSSVDEIASAVYQLLGRIQDQGSTFN